jgi:ribonuclease Z
MGIPRGFVILSVCLAFTSAAWAQDFKVTLLGTGVSFPATDRFGAATLVEAGKERLLFDVGRGATIRLNQIGVSIGTLNAVFLTHFHSDHTSGIPDLWSQVGSAATTATGRPRSASSGRKAPCR